jgi:hypothetical protein
MKFRWLGILGILTLQTTAFAQTEIKFTQRELGAGVILMRPELNSLELHDQGGVFTPAPSLRALGVDDVSFDLNFSGISQLAGIRFNHLRSRAPEIRFEGENLLVTVPVVDQVGAGRSVLGTISVKNVLLRARLSWRTRPNGSAELYVASTGFSGTITGTGALRPSFMIALVEKLFLNTLENQASRILIRPGVQEGVQTGLITWAKISTGREWREIIPDSVKFYTQGAESGLRYQVQ